MFQAPGIHQGESELIVFLLSRNFESGKRKGSLVFRRGLTGGGAVKHETFLPKDDGAGLGGPLLGGGNQLARWHLHLGIEKRTGMWCQSCQRHSISIPNHALVTKGGKLVFLVPLLPSFIPAFCILCSTPLLLLAPLSPEIVPTRYLSWLACMCGQVRLGNESTLQVRRALRDRNVDCSPEVSW